MSGSIWLPCSPLYVEVWRPGPSRIAPVRRVGGLPRRIPEVMRSIHYVVDAQYPPSEVSSFPFDHEDTKDTKGKR